MTNKQPWALILGASSGFGEATALELARAGMNIFGVHMDRYDQLMRVGELEAKIRGVGRRPLFINGNAALDDTRHECVEKLKELVVDPPGTLRVILHSISYNAMKPLAGAEQVISRSQLELTSDVMAHSLVYWVQDCLRAGLLERGARVFALTSIGSSRVLPSYGPVGGAKALLESYIRQLAVELAPAGITANAILAGTTDSPTLRANPHAERILELARIMNPNRRLTLPEDVARCIAALTHPATYWLTGNVLHVDGGESIVGG